MTNPYDRTNPTNPDLPREVVFRTVTPARFVLPAVIVALIAAGSVSVITVSDGASVTTAVILSVVAAVALLVPPVALGLVLANTGKHTWDLSTETITYGRRTFAFAEITRVVAFTGDKGRRSLLFSTAAGRIGGMVAPLRGSGRDPIGREQWLAIRALLAAPHLPTLEGYGQVGVGARNLDRDGPLTLLRGSAALDLVDTQIARIDAGRRQSDSHG